MLSASTVSGVKEFYRTTTIIVPKKTKKVMGFMKVPIVYRNLVPTGGSLKF